MKWVECAACGATSGLFESSPNLCSNCGATLTAVDRVQGIRDEAVRKLFERGGPVTRELPALGSTFTVPLSVRDMVAKAEGSLAGYSKVASWMTCPEKARLEALKVRRRPVSFGDVGEFGAIIEPMEPTEFGTLIHTLLGIRVLYGQPWAEEWLRVLPDIHPDDRMKALNIVKVYDATYPLDLDPFEYLGIEVEVFSDIGDGKGGSIIRSVRYDTIIRYEGRVYSMERKTDARGSIKNMVGYSAQLATQQTVWNMNPSLVEKYGPMPGVIGEVIAKTAVPRIERLDPREFPSVTQKRVLLFLRLPELVRYPVAEDGSYPRILSACYGKWRPCQFIDLCWEDAQNAYEVAA